MSHITANHAASVSTTSAIHILNHEAVWPDLLRLIEAAVNTIAASKASDDAILGDFAGLASLSRSVGVHEGRLLEEAIGCIAETSPNLKVLRRLRLPVTKAALEAVRNNPVEKLKALAFDVDSVARESYRPDLVVVDLSNRVATILDIKRSTVSYGDTTRLDSLRTRMIAASLVLPDYLYKIHLRTTVDEAFVGIVDGSSRQHNPGAGVWPLSQIDEILSIQGAASSLAEVRRLFGEAVRELLITEARTAIGAVNSALAPGAIISPLDGDETDWHSSRAVHHLDDNVVTGGSRFVRFGVLRTGTHRSA